MQVSADLTHVHVGDVTLDVEMKSRLSGFALSPSTSLPQARARTMLAAAYMVPL